MKLSTPRTIANCVLLCRILLFSVAPVLALTTALLTANTIAVPGGPEATNVGGEPTDASATFTNRASTLTIELLSLLTAAQTKKDLGEVFLTLDNTRGSGSVSSSRGMLSDFASRGGAVSVVSSTLSNPVLTGQAHSGSHYWFGTEDDIVGPYFKANASIAGNAPHDLIVQGTGEFGLSIAGLAQAGDSRRTVTWHSSPTEDSIPKLPPPGITITHCRRSPGLNGSLVMQ